MDGWMDRWMDGWMDGFDILGPESGSDERRRGLFGGGGFVLGDRLAALAPISVESIIRR